jgi:hypothetical protein
MLTDTANGGGATIGAYYWNIGDTTDRFRGTMDEFMFFTSALQPNDIAYIYAH